MKKELAELDEKLSQVLKSEFQAVCDMKDLKDWSETVKNLCEARMDLSGSYDNERWVYTQDGK